MTIVVGYIPTPEGEAALERAAQEARDRDRTVVVVVSANGKRFEPDIPLNAVDTVRERLMELGVRHEIRHVDLGQDVSGDIVGTAIDVDAEMIVIGLRRRSPLGKLFLGSNAQKILLDAPCAVLAVKAAETKSSSE